MCHCSLCVHIWQTNGLICELDNNHCYMRLSLQFQTTALVSPSFHQAVTNKMTAPTHKIAKKKCVCQGLDSIGLDVKRCWWTFMLDDAWSRSPAALLHQMVLIKSLGS